MDMREKISQALYRALTAAFEQTDFESSALARSLELPPEPEMGDMAFPCFSLSKTLRMAPPQIAQKIAVHVADPLISSVEVKGGYLNFFLDRVYFAQKMIEAVQGSDGAWGQSDEGSGKTICIDYSSINIAKRFHIGHLSTTAIGHSLKRIYDYLGYRTVGINHLGDWGTQFGKMIAAYKHWGSPEMVEQGGVQALSELYVRFHKEAEESPSLEDEGRAWFKRIEEGDKEALAIFNNFKEITLKDADRVYDILDVSFDSYAGESFYNDKMDRVIRELREKNLLVLSQGAWVVDLEEFGMPPCLILKSDGATLYATRDIAAALYRKDTYHFSKCLYVVAYQQDLHFRQVFKVLELMGYEWAKTQMEHVAFGMISYEGEALSTRRGNIVHLDELLDKAQEKALAIIEEKSPHLEDKEKIAKQVGVGSVIFFDLFNSRIKDIDFRWDRALNFDGETGPYVQYTYARCCSVLRKAGEVDTAPDFSALDDKESLALLKLISLFPETIRDAAARNEPSFVTRAITEMAKAYNKFYYEHRILSEDAAASAARLALTDIVRAAIANGLYLIGMQAPPQM
ncbi:MAG: arginine--tRNA ligase [Clostridiales bacterium]|nr:arginine--tRNA ligase [Clostridiales bacterium]